MLVNNGKGAEFRLYWHPAAAFKEDADAFMAAGGHFGNKSANLVKHYAEDLGFEYIRFCLRCLPIVQKRMKHYLQYVIWQRIQLIKSNKLKNQ